MAEQITSLSPEQRGIYPQVIYRLESGSPIDQASTWASYSAMKASEFPIVADIEDESSERRVVIRTSSGNRNERAIQSAIFLGLTEATRRRIGQSEQGIESLVQEAQDVAGGLLTELTDRPRLYEAFRNYYGGLRWSTDQGKFVQTLFEHGTDFNSEFLDQSLRGNHVSNLLHHLDLDIPYDQRRDWYEAEPAEIFAKFPQLDYRRLEDESFAGSPEGQALKTAYAKLSGEMLTQRSAHSSGFLYSNEQEPTIPLARFPIIEALIVDEVSVDRPHAKYDFGPQDLTELILTSDSKPAHEALIASINARLPKELRQVFDGPDEFGHKHQLIRNLLRSYKATPLSDEGHDQLKQDLISVIDSYTGNGMTAESVRDENEAWRARGFDHDSLEVNKIKDIVKDLLIASIASADPDIIGRAEDLIAQYIPAGRRRNSKEDVLALKRADLMLVLLDALNGVSLESRPEVFERLGTKIFRNDAIGRRLEEFAEVRIQSIQIRRSPEALQARNQLEKYGFSVKDDPKRQNDQDTYDRLIKPANQLDENLRTAKNQLLLNLLVQIAGPDNRGGNREIGNAFRGLLKRVNFSLNHGRELPQEYTQLIDLAGFPTLSDSQRNDILWHFQEQFQYVSADATHLLVPVILDMYRIALGPIDAVHAPTRETDHGLSAIVSLVGKHGHELFKAASPEQLQTLTRYTEAIKEQVRQLAAGALLTDGQLVENIDMEGLNDWQKDTLRIYRHVLEELDIIEGYYDRYLRVEAAKVSPSVYYPLVLEQFAPFWQKMQWEVGPGNRPNPDIRALYEVLADHVRNKLVISGDYPETFDAVEDGHLDTLLKEGYERMVVPHDIKYNGTVWREGLSFMSQAVSLMPESVLAQMIAKYPNTPFAKWLVTEHKRWSDDREV